MQTVLSKYQCLEWIFPVVKYPHFSSDAPDWNCERVALSVSNNLQLHIGAFKDIVQSRAFQIFQRDYLFDVVRKKWKAHHQARFNHDKVTDYPRLQS